MLQIIRLLKFRGSGTVRFQQYLGGRDFGRICADLGKPPQNTFTSPPTPSQEPETSDSFIDVVFPFDSSLVGSDPRNSLLRADPRLSRTKHNPTGLTTRLRDRIRCKALRVARHAVRGYQVAILSTADVGQRQGMAQFVRQKPNQISVDVPDPGWIQFTLHQGGDG